MVIPRILLPLLLLLAVLIIELGESDAQAPTALGVDVVTSGNAADLVSSVQACVEVDVGDRFPVDIYVQGARELRAWELRFVFNHEVVQIVGHDFNLFLLSTAPSGSIFPSLFEVEKPDRYFLAAAEFSGTPDSGSGVLTRLTLEAVAPGRSPAVIATDPSYLSPRLTDADGDDLFVGPISQAEVAVGEPCVAGPPEPTPTPTPTPTPAPPDPTPTPAPSPDPDGTPDVPGPTATPPPLVLLPPDGAPGGDGGSVLLPPSNIALSDSTPAEGVSALVPAVAVALSDSPPEPPSSPETDEQQQPSETDEQQPSEEETTSEVLGEAEPPADDGDEDVDSGARTISPGDDSSSVFSLWMLGVILAAAVVAAGGIVIVMSLRNR